MLSLIRYMKWEFVLGAILIFIGVIALYRKLKGYKGTWNETYFYDPVLGGGKRIEGDRFNTYSNRDSKGERECRRVLESIFHKPFPNKRPNFMKNIKTGRNLELDCYNSDLKIACEYNGRQHYEFLAHFHGTRDAFHKQQANDRLTRERCMKNGVYLIEVPYTVKIQNIEKFIFAKLRSSGLIKY